MRARYIIGREGSIDPTDRGLAYGDGLFETMAVHDATISRLALHLDRLALGCERLAIPFPDESELEQQIGQATTGITSGVLKLILTRGPGERGYLPPESPQPTVVLLAAAVPEKPVTEISVTVLAQRLGENVQLAGLKHLNRLEQVLGRLELTRLDADEGLMLTTSENVIGGTSRNLFVVTGDTILTPAVDRAGIAGVMRRTVLEQCARLGIDVEVGKLTTESLGQADELFMTNALVGIQSVSRLDGKQFTARAMATRLRESLATDPTDPITDV